MLQDGYGQRSIVLPYHIFSSPSWYGNLNVRKVWAKYCVINFIYKVKHRWLSNYQQHLLLR